MLYRFNNTIAPLLAESYVDESFGASVIFPHVLHQPNVLRVKHDGPSLMALVNLKYSALMPQQGNP